MKKKFCFLLITSLIMSFAISFGALADGEIIEKTNEFNTEAVGNLFHTPQFTSDKIVLNVHVEEIYNLLPKNMVFGIYSPSGQFWGAKHIWVSKAGADYQLVFDTPQYNVGEQLGIKVFSGAQEIRFMNKVYKCEEIIPLKTSSYIDTSNTRIYNNEFSINTVALTAEKVTAFANEWQLYFQNPAKLIDDTCMIPLMEYLCALGMEDRVMIEEETGKIDIVSNGHNVVFYLDGKDMYADDEVTYSNTVPMKINDIIYVPFRFLVEGLGGSVEAVRNEENRLIVTTEFHRQPSPAEIVNSEGITSQTDFLIWISKKDFKVHLLKRDNDVWRDYRSFDCTIGKPSTPTITGEYEYHSREEKWPFAQYYVAPIMRFYKGYALHSTLINYDGTPHDDRLREMLSHGCVRMAPKDILWLIEKVPLYTKVYITN